MRRLFTIEPSATVPLDRQPEIYIILFINTAITVKRSGRNPDLCSFLDAFDKIKANGCVKTHSKLPAIPMTQHRPDFTCRVYLFFISTYPIYV